MITYESQRGRRILGRLERGESLVEAIEQLAREHTVTTGTVEAFGVLAEVTFSHYDAGARARTNARVVTGPVELVSLRGTLASTDGVLRAELSGLVSKETEFGPVVVGGHVVGGEVIALDVVVHALDDLGVRRVRDDRSGLDLLAGESRRAESAPAPRSSIARVAVAPVREPLVERPIAKSQVARPVTESPASPTSNAWAMVAAASESGTRAQGVVDPIDDPLGAQTKPKNQEEYLPKAGEYVDHRQFGLCRVDKVGPDGELVIRLETGRRKEIRIDVFEVSAPKKEGSRVVYALRPRRANS